ncbi:MAG: biosynthetic-type acetolactate synthase large subunit [SAR324 cluster bacterium]|nr:biosynthetic-type acetolactate synthase large subunit [SAR324 cluster bacterium]
MNIGVSQKLTTKLGSHIILETILEQGIDKVFGYPGGCVIPLFDALLKYPALKFYLVRHEQGATHAADGLARATGKAQVVFATSGPGATNCMTGIATALMDSVPLIVITGQVKKSVIGTNAFQETNVVGLSRPITKHNFLINDIKELQFVLRKAFFIANTGRKGPVLIDIPVDIQTESCHYDSNPKPIVIRGYQDKMVAADDLVEKAWQMIAKAKKPIIYAGGGSNSKESSDELIKFIKKTKLPITTTLLAQGVYPERDSLSLGMLGMHGTYGANIAMTKCDLCLVIGARFDDRVTGEIASFLKQSKIIHVDLDPSSINKVKISDLNILSDSLSFLQKINLLARQLDTTKWLKQLDDIKAKAPLKQYIDYQPKTDKLRPEYILKLLSDITKGKAFIVTDVGQHQMFTSLHYSFMYPRSHITSGGLGTMGFSLPAAMGIATEFKDRVVISISGDGGFQMCMQELAMIRDYSLAVKIFIFNNRNLGMVKQWQDFFWEARYASTTFDFNPSFTMIGKAFDIPSYAVREKNEVAGAINKALNTKGPVLVEFKIDPDSHVFPMVPAGAKLSDIITK